MECQNQTIPNVGRISTQLKYTYQSIGTFKNSLMIYNVYLLLSGTYTAELFVSIPVESERTVRYSIRCILVEARGISRGEFRYSKSRMYLLTSDDHLEDSNIAAGRGWCLVGGSSIKVSTSSLVGVI